MRANSAPPSRLPLATPCATVSLSAGGEPVIYASGMAVAMSVVAVNDHPFAGQDALPPTALTETLQQFAPR